MISRVLPLSFTGLLAALALHAATAAETPSGTLTTSLRFQPDGKGGFRFDTGTLRGRLHGDGKSLGLTQVEHVPTKARLDRSNGLLSHYRVFSRGKRYATGAWDWPSTASLLRDGRVEIEWPAASDRPFEMRALYRLAESNSIEVETTVTAGAALPAFEVFLASYFDPAFTNAVVLAKSDQRPAPVTATLERGEWQMYPRDATVRRIIEDGRWKLEPHPVEWTIPGEFAGPMATVFRRAPATALTATLRSPSKDCFAVALPHQTEAHFSVYLSLFGRDLQSAETAVARVRLSSASTPAGNRL
jgi:hypothetical protein